MKGILVALALLQLVLLSEGWPKTRRIGWDSKLSTKLTRICPLNPKLAAWKKALRLALKRDRGKRELARGFPIHWCNTVGLLELDDGPFIYYPLVECCQECHDLIYKSCTKHYHHFICASRVHKCSCDCHEKHWRKLTGSEKMNTSRRICFKKTCGSRSGKCCTEDQCVKLNVRKRAIRYKQHLLKQTSHNL